MRFHFGRRHAPHAFASHPPHSVYRNIAYGFLAATVIVAVGALWVSSARARITVKTKRVTTNLETFVDVAKVPDPGQLRGRVVQGVFEKVQEFPVTEGTSVEGVVRGVVTIVNNYSQPQTLIKTTRLLTSDGKLYRIDKTITVNQKESVRVPAYADKPGATYALTAGTKLTIPGLWPDLQKWIYAEVASNFSANQSVTKIVRQADIDAAYETLEKAVMDEAEKTLKAEAGIADAYTVFKKTVVSKKTIAKPGDTAETFLASVKVDVSGIFTPTQELNAFIRQKLKEKIPDDRQMVDIDSSRAVIEAVQSDVKAEKARLHVTATAGTQLTADSPQLAKVLILGLSEENARLKLQSVESVESVDIRIRPTWIHSIPSSASHVELIVQ